MVLTAHRDATIPQNIPLANCQKRMQERRMTFAAAPHNVLTFKINHNTFFKNAQHVFH